MIIDTKTYKIVTNILKIYNINIDKCYKFLYNEEKKDGMFTLENLWDYEAENKRIENTIRNEGVSQGIEQNTKHIILNMLNNNFSYDDISKATGISKGEIKDYIL